jgi:hypothetical protein
MQHHPDALEQAIRDKQARYVHEAYLVRPGSHPARRWIGNRVIRLGQVLAGTANA